MMTGPKTPLENRYISSQVPDPSCLNGQTQSAVLFFAGGSSHAAAPEDSLALGAAVCGVSLGLSGPPGATTAPERRFAWVSWWILSHSEGWDAGKRVVG